MEPGAPSAIPTGTSTTLKSYAVCLATKISKLCRLLITLFFPFRCTVCVMFVQRFQMRNKLLMSENKITHHYLYTYHHEYNTIILY